MSEMTNEQKRAALSAQTNLPANVEMALKETESERPKPRRRADGDDPIVVSRVIVQPAIVKSEEEIFYISPEALSAIHIQINARLKHRLNMATVRHKSCNTNFRTHRDIIESAIKMWLDRYEKPPKPEIAA